MKQVAARYEKAAKKINAKRSDEHDRFSTVVYVLSESFSDPSRVPGLKINKDSMPNIRKIKAGHHVRPDAVLRIRRRHRQSGIHGTVRPEHGEFRFLPDQPVPAAGAERALDADHQPDVGRVQELHRTATRTSRRMYSRATNYKKFGFSHFYTLTGPDVISSIRTRSTIRRTSPTRPPTKARWRTVRSDQVEPVPAGHHHAEPHALPRLV